MGLSKLRALMFVSLLAVLCLTGFGEGVDNDPCVPTCQAIFNDPGTIRYNGPVPRLEWSGLIERDVLDDPTADLVAFRLIYQGNVIFDVVVDGSTFLPVTDGFRFGPIADASEDGGVELLTVFPHRNGRFWLVHLIAYAESLNTVKNVPAPLLLSVELDSLATPHCANSLWEPIKNGWKMASIVVE